MRLDKFANLLSFIELPFHHPQPAAQSFSEEASRSGAALIDMIDGETPCDLLYDLKLGESVQTVERVAVDLRWHAAVLRKGAQNPAE